MARSSKSGTTTKTTKARVTAAGPKPRGATSVTTSKASTTSKAAAAETANPRAHLRAVAPPETVQEPTAPSADMPADGANDTDGRFKRQALLEAVCAKTPIKRSDAKTLVELVLDELGRAIDVHDELILPPLGKFAIKRRNTEGAGGDILTIKLKRMPEAGGTSSETPLAAPRKDG